VPEGDTIHQARLRLLPILEHSTVVRFWVRKIRGYRPRAGQRIETVRVHGKHLLVDFAPALTLQVHLGLGGWWNVEPGVTDDDNILAQHRRDPRLRVYLATDRGIAVCYGAPTIQTFVRGDDDGAPLDGTSVPSALTPLTNLGPDLRVDDDGRSAVVEQAVARTRARRPGSELMMDLLLDQQVAAGAGNVYKSEVLFLERIWPFTPVSELDDKTLETVFKTASRLLWINSQRADSQRTTTPFSGNFSDLHGGVFVYQRFRAPCRRCETPIKRTYSGRYGRSTYWCPRCQREPGKR